MPEGRTVGLADMVIKGGKIVGGGQITPPAWVVVNDEKITANIYYAAFVSYRSRGR